MSGKGNEMDEQHPARSARSVPSARAEPAERVTAYVDGEMAAAERAAFERTMAEDADLAAAVAREQRLRAQLADAFDPVLDEPVPARLQALFGAPAAEGASGPAPTPPIDLAEERRRRRGGWMAWGGMAASLALGVLIGARWLAPDADLERARDGSWRAGGSLAAALETQLSGASADSAGPRVGMSFVAHDGRYCRAFSTSAPGAVGGSAGLACRSDDGWHVAQLTAQASPAKAPSDGFRTAASPWPAALLSAIDEQRAGDPLSVEDERAAMAREWKPK